MKLGVVVNPYAGRGADGELEKLVRGVVEKLGRRFWQVKTSLERST